MTIVIQAGATETDSVNVLYRNIFQEGTISWSSQANGFPAINATEDETWNSWRPTVTGAHIIVDMGSAVTCDAAGIASHNAGDVGAGFRIRYSSNGTDWNNASGQHYPVTNETIMFLFPAVSARYWQLQVLTTPCNVGCVSIGPKLAFPNAPLSGHTPIHHAKNITMLSNESQGGQFLGTKVEKVGAETGVSLGLLDRDFVENEVSGFEHAYNNGHTFFYCGSPLSTPKDMGYCRRPQGDGVMGITWEEGSLMAQVDFSVKVFIDA